LFVILFKKTIFWDSKPGKVLVKSVCAKKYLFFRKIFNFKIFFNETFLFSLCGFSFYLFLSILVDIQKSSYDHITIKVVFEIPKLKKVAQNIKIFFLLRNLDPEISFL